MIVHRFSSAAHQYGGSKRTPAMRRPGRKAVLHPKKACLKGAEQGAQKRRPRFLRKPTGGTAAATEVFILAVLATPVFLILYALCRGYLS